MILGSGSRQDLLKKLTQITLENLEDKHFGSKELAFRAGMSISTLNRHLHAFGCDSSTLFIREIRMQQARKLLHEGRFTVGEVSDKVGYSSQAYFSKCYHDFFGHAPGETTVQDEPDHQAGSGYIEKNLPVNKDDYNSPGIAASAKGARLARAGPADHRWRPKNKPSYLLVIVFLILLISALLTLTNSTWRERLFRQSAGERSIAVLPFNNLSPDPDNQYFADGITADIINDLYLINDLRVVSKNTSEHFRDSKLSTREIALMTGARYLLSGSVRKDGNRLRITVHLIDGSNDHHIWSENYDRQLTDIFSIQSDIARNVANKLQTLFTTTEKQGLRENYTNSYDAYDFYLRGKDYANRSWQELDILLAKQMYEKAVDIDPGFALAWSGIAEARRLLFWFYWDRSEENRTRARESLDMALALQPESKEVLTEEGKFHYNFLGEYHEALRLFENLRTRYPNDGEVLYFIGMVYRRMGEFLKSLDYCHQAIQVSPYSFGYYSDVGNTYYFIGEYAKAEQYYMKSLELNPSKTIIYDFVFGLYLVSGQIQKAKEFLLAHERYFAPLAFKLFKGKLEYLSRDYQKALQTIGSLAADQLLYSRQREAWSKHLQLAMVYRAIPDYGMANLHFRAERELMLGLIGEKINDDRFYRTLGIACAGLGLREEALSAIGSALNLKNYQTDRYEGIQVEADKVKILVLLGEYEEALAALDHLVGQCNYPAAEFLASDPFWDPLRDHETFRRILDKNIAILNTDL